MNKEAEIINQKIPIPVQTIKEFSKTHKISFLAIFGSYARGDYREDSDIDFLVRFKAKKTLIDIIEDEIELMDILQKKVQFVEEDTVPLELRDKIEKEKIILYEE